MKDFIGLNVHVAFKPELYKPVVSRVRDYHPLPWDLSNKDTSVPPPFPHGNPIDWDQLLGSWKNAGYTIDESIQVEMIPASQWKDIDRDGFAYGQAYAKNFGPSGSNLVSSVEIGNEPQEKSWSNTDYPKIFKSMARGFRDGDPKLKIVTCAINAGNPDAYSKPTSCLEGLQDLYDVLNIHTYSMITGWPTWRRVNPERPGIAYLKSVNDLISWRNVHAPDKEIWITEFGYDAKSANQPKPTGDFAGWISSTETEQAQWLVRSFLVFSSMDVDAAYLYYFDDRDSPIFHGSSGITRNFKPKPSFYALAHLRKTLGDYRFSKVITRKEESQEDAARDDAAFKKDLTGGDAASSVQPATDIPTDNAPLYVYEYINPDKPTEPIWVAWLPTSSQHTSVQKIAVTGQVIKAERMPLKDGDAEAVDFKTESDGIELTVTESPTYIYLRQ